jgi:hypothetical protein
MKKTAVVMVAVGLVCAIVFTSWLRQQKYAGVDGALDATQQETAAPSASGAIEPSPDMPDDVYPEPSWSPFDLPPLEPGPCTITGTVTAIDDSPVPDAEVLAMRFSDERGESFARKHGVRTVSESDGSYRFDNLPLGVYHIVGRTSDLWGYEQAGFQDESEHEPVEIRVAPTTVEYGILRNAEGVPIANARVGRYARRPKPDEPDHLTYISGPFPLAATITDKNGAYALPVEAKVSHIIGAEAEGYAFATSPEVGFGGIKYGLALKRGGRVTGTVTFADSGEPAPGVTVAAPHRSEYRDMIHATTDREGFYALNHLPAMWNHRITVKSDRYAAIENYRVKLQEDETKTVNLQISGGGSIAGTVTFSGTGEPAVGTTVTLNGPTHQKRIWLTSANDGSFLFSRLSPGEYDVVCQMPKNGLWSHEDRADGLELHETVQLGIDENITGIEFQFERAGTISGRITDPAGRGVAAVTMVGLGNRDGHHYSSRTTPDEEGRYTIKRVAPGGRYVIKINSETFGRIHSPYMDVPPDGEVTGMDVQFKLPCSISGRVVDVTGMPVPDVTVRMSCRGLSGWTKDCETFMAGEFEFGAIQPGTHGFGARRGDQHYIMLSEPVTITAGQRIEDVKVVVRRWGNWFEETLHGIFN